MALGRKAKVFGGALSSGLPMDDFEAALAAPESVASNLDHLRPMVKAINAMTETEGWREYVLPFLEKQSDAAQLIEIVKKGEDGKFMAAKIEAYRGLLNLIGTFRRTGEGLAKIDAAKAVKDKEEAES